MTIAKGITSSQIPAGGVVVNSEIAAFMDSVRWNHVSTFAGHPIAMAAAQANIEYMIENDIPEMSRKAGEYFGAALSGAREEAQDDRLGRGGRACSGRWSWSRTRRPGSRSSPKTATPPSAGDTSKNPTGIVLGKCLEKGVLLGGYMPNTLRIGASLTVSKADMDKAVDALDYALDYLDTCV